MAENDDDFIRHLLGAPDDNLSAITPNSVDEEIQRLETLLFQNGSQTKLRNFPCPKCKKSYSFKYNLTRHFKTGACERRKRTEVNHCSQCDKIFMSTLSLNRHLRSVHGQHVQTDKRATSRCSGCHKQFSSLANVKKHVKNGSCRHMCGHCSDKISSVGGMRTHIRAHMNNEYLDVSQLRKLRKQLKQLENKVSNTRTRSPQPGPSGVQSSPPQPSSPPSSSSSSSSSSDNSDTDETSYSDGRQSPAYEQQRTENFNRTLIKYQIVPRGTEVYDMLHLFSNRRQQLSSNIARELKRLRSLKWYICVKVNMTKYAASGEVKDKASPTFRSVTQIVLLPESVPDQIDTAYFKVSDSMERFKRDGSGWRLDDIAFLQQTMVKYNPLRGSCSTFAVPAFLRKKACLLSVVGCPANNFECFRWSVLAGLHIASDVTGEVHWTELKRYGNLLNFNNVKDRGERMSLSQIPEFEKDNRITINIIGYSEELFPLHISRNWDSNTDKHVNLLLIKSNDDGTDEETHTSDGHYCVIQDVSRLLSGKYNGRLFYCMRCLNPKYSADKLREHERLCNELQPLNVVTVEEDKKWMEFRNYRRQLECPFVIVADFECYSLKLYDKDEPTHGQTVRERKLEPCAFSYLRISRDDCHPSSPVVYVGKNPEDTMMEFFRCMDEEEKTVFEILSQIEPLTWCDEGVNNLMKSNDACYACESPFLPKAKKCIDHDHLTGKIRGNLCNRCNLQLQEANFLPILFHNLSQFDGRLIMSAVGKYGHKNVTVLPQSVDTYISITINRCRYLDSKRFLNAGLATLAESALSETGPVSFKHTRKHMGDEHANLFLRKQVFCYDYFDGPERLTETKLPPKSAFFDRLSDKDVSHEEYDHALAAWRALDMQTMRDYLVTYIKSDVLLLADVLTIFRETMMEDFRLDPLHYFSLSGYSFDCALRYSGVKLELLTDLEMHLCIESAIRGGLAIVGSPRYAKANNPDMSEEEYDPTKPASFIHFFDFNGLYTSVMQKQRLPTYGFRWLSDSEIERFDVMSIAVDSDHGYIVDCDLEYPDHLHDLHDQMPLAPERISIRAEDLSEYSRKIAQECGISLDNIHEIQKLCLTLKDKTRYVTHYLNLQLYLKYGLVLRRVHRVIKFTQTQWLQDFMTFVAEKRRRSKSKINNFMYKAIPNRVYGKLLESVRSHKDVRICTTQEKLKKLVSLPTFATLHEFDVNLAAVQMHRQRVVLNKPYVVGFCVLELAKRETYEFYYEFVQPEFKEGKVSLLTHDTDSYVIKIDGIDDVNNILKANSHRFDFSNLPEGHVLKNDTNRMKPGYLKFELEGQVCCEFCALSPKCYSVRTNSGFKQTAKGSRKKLTHEMYKNCLLAGSCHADQVREIRNYGQELYQVSVMKRILSPLDTKRFYIDGTNSLSFGHYKIRAGRVEELL